jgi:heme iron utilization protein
MTEAKKDVLRPTDAEAIRLGRTLLRAARHAALAVLEPESGWPLASRVSVATDCAGRPLILVSTLSAHTGGLVADARCALLFGEAGKGDPLAHPRMTLKCRAERIGRESEDHAGVAQRFLARHPKAALYADFADFSYFRLEPEEASLNGGFGKAYRLARDEVMSNAAVARELEQAGPGAVAHMNGDHRGIDPDGFDLMAGDRAARIFFAEPLKSAGQMREMLVQMARDARGREAG